MSWWNRKWGMLSTTQVELLKARIEARLATEDYTCRLPRVHKPRIRHKLRKYRMILNGEDVRVWA